MRLSLFYCEKDICNSYVPHGLKNITKNIKNNFKKIIGNVKKKKKMFINKVWYK